MKKTKVFISYRNIKRNGTYENYQLLLKLKSALETQNYKCQFIPPEKIPGGTIFSPYDIADFLQLTFTLMDDCDKFIILDQDYFYENGELTSIWTEAEYCIWSYYSRRKEFLNRYKTKDCFYTHAKPSNNEFLFYQSPLYDLSKAQRTLLRICSLDFDHTSLVNYSSPYRRTSKYLMTICTNCQKIYTVEAKKLKKMREASAVCSCGNVFQFGIDKGYYVCSQTASSALPKGISIFDALELLFEKRPVHELLELAERSYV